MDQLGESTPISDVPFEILQVIPEVSNFISQESGCALVVGCLYVQIFVC